MKSIPACRLEPKTCTCPCGHRMAVPMRYDDFHMIQEWVYAVCNETGELTCPKCGRSASGGNYKSGEVSSWITAKAAYESQREYERQSFEADMNEWYGRGEW